MKSKRQVLREKQKKKERLNYLLWGGIAVAILGVLGFTLLNNGSARPAQGEAVQVMADVGHVPDGTDPGPFNSDPPTSGKHYANSLEPGFYEDGDVSSEFPQGHLVHNLEHGYIVFWYNCDLLSEQDCTQLKDDIKAVMAKESTKVVAFPWKTTDVPVVMTSWGRLLRMEKFDASTAISFIQSNRNKAPEPNAQ